MVDVLIGVLLAVSALNAWQINELRKAASKKKGKR